MQNTGLSRILLSVAMCWGFACDSLNAQSAVFIDFRDLLNGQPSANPSVVVSSDGSTVFGQQFAPTGEFAFRWHPGELPETLFVLDDTPGFAFPTSGITGVADDGSAFVSHWISDLPNSSEEPFRWTESGGPEGLGSLSAGHFLTPWTFASSLSGDGRTVIGSTNDPPGLSGPFEWTVSDGLQPRNDGRRSLNYDGSIAAGTSNGRASLFTENGVIPIGPPGSFGRKISSDGKFVLVRVGDRLTGSTENYFLWSERDGLVELSPPVGSTEDFLVSVFSDDGNTAIGFCGGWCIWKRGVGSMRLEDYFFEIGLADAISSINLVGVHSISADGAVITGVGYDSVKGKDFSWAVLLVPEPGAATLATLTLLLSFRCRRWPR